MVWNEVLLFCFNLLLLLLLFSLLLLLVLLLLLLHHIKYAQSWKDIYFLKLPIYWKIVFLFIFTETEFKKNVEVSKEKTRKSPQKKNTQMVNFPYFLEITRELAIEKCECGLHRSSLCVQEFWSGINVT